MDEKIQEFTREEMALPNWSCAGHLQTEMTKQLCVCVCVCLWCASNHTWPHNERSSDTWYEGYAR